MIKSRLFSDPWKNTTPKNTIYHVQLGEVLGNTVYYSKTVVTANLVCMNPTQIFNIILAMVHGLNECVGFVKPYIQLPKCTVSL